MSLVKRYDRFILKNASAISTVESAIRTLTYVLPSRFDDNQLVSEAIYATCGLVGLYHDSIIARAVASMQTKPAITPHGRYTKYWYVHSGVYRNLALFVSTLQSLSFLLEILARKTFGEKGRWRLVIAIEVVKSLARVYLLRVTGWRPLVYPHVPERAMEPAALEQRLSEEVAELEAKSHGENGSALQPNGHSTTKEERRRSSVGIQTQQQNGQKLNPSEVPGALTQITANGGDPIEALQIQSPDKEARRISQQFKSAQQVQDYLGKRAIRLDDLTPAQHLLLPLTRVRCAAELAYVFRPVVYAILLSRATDKRSWRPWLIGIAIEYAALELHRLALQSHNNGGASGDFGSGSIFGGGALSSASSSASSAEGGAVAAAARRRPTKLEKQELLRRAFAMSWWLMRGACYTTRTRVLLFENLARFAQARAGISHAASADSNAAAMAAANTVQHAGILAGASHSLWGIVAGVAREYGSWYDNYFTTATM